MQFTACATVHRGLGTGPTLLFAISLQLTAEAGTTPGAHRDVNSLTSSSQGGQSLTARLSLAACSSSTQLSTNGPTGRVQAQAAKGSVSSESCAQALGPAYLALLWAGPLVHSERQGPASCQLPGAAQAPAGMFPGASEPRAHTCPSDSDLRFQVRVLDPQFKARVHGQVGA